MVKEPAYLRARPGTSCRCGHYPCFSPCFEAETDSAELLGQSGPPCQWRPARSSTGTVADLTGQSQLDGALSRPNAVRRRLWIVPSWARLPFRAERDCVGGSITATGSWPGIRYRAPTPHLKVLRDLGPTLVWKASYRCQINCKGSQLSFRHTG